MAIKFTWDKRKAKRNLAKHSVSFETASQVFADPYVIFLEDFEDEFDEWRYLAIGRARSEGLLLVVYVDRSNEADEIIHIISARKVTDYEQTAYTDQF